MQVIVVDDKSPDGTGDLVQRLKAEFPKLLLLRRQGKLGLGTAYVDGLKLAKGQFVILMDADLSHLPNFIPQFKKKMQQTNADIVTGTRYNKGGGVYGWPFKRKLISRCANLLANQLLGTDMSDLTGSFRLYKKNVLQQLLKQVQSKGYSFQMQILIRANKLNYKIQQVPIIFVDRIYGESKLGGKQIINFLKCLWNLVWDVQ